MHPKLRVRTTFALFLLVAAGLSAASIDGRGDAGTGEAGDRAAGDRSRAPPAGKRFTVSFRVTRSDTGKPLTLGKMICDPSIAGKAIAHAESFRPGSLGSRCRAGDSGSTQVAAGEAYDQRRGPVDDEGHEVPHGRAEVASLVSIGDASVAEGNAGTRHCRSRSRSQLRARRPSRLLTTADGTATTP